MTRILDTFDLDQYMGEPIQPARMREEIHSNHSPLGVTRATARSEIQLPKE